MTAPEPPPRPVSWLEMLTIAATTEEVLSVVRDYTSGLTPGEMAILPVACRPPARFGTPEEVVDFAACVVHAELGPHSGNDVLARMATFFSNASRRIAQLMSKPRPIGAANG